jgi:hypothetical protein
LGSDLYVINDEKWYYDDEYAELDETIPIVTGGGVIYLTVVGNVFITICNGNLNTMILLIYTVLVRDFPLNIFSGERLYLRGGYIDRNNIYNKDSKVFVTIDVKSCGFML